MVQGKEVIPRFARELGRTKWQSWVSHHPIDFTIIISPSDAGATIAMSQGHQNG